MFGVFGRAPVTTSRRLEAPQPFGVWVLCHPGLPKTTCHFHDSCPFPNPKTPPNIVPMRPSCRWNQSRPAAAGHGAPLPLASLHPHCNLLAARSGTKWYRMVQKLNFSLARQPASRPGHGRGALWPMASLHPHRNLSAARSGTKRYRMVRKLNFSPARQPASQSGAWPSRPIAHGLSASALQPAGPPEWDEMGQNGRGTQFFPGPPTSKPVRGMAISPYCPWPLCIRTAICRLPGVVQNGTEWYGNSIFPRPANQQASPGHGQGIPGQAGLESHRQAGGDQ